MRSLILLAYALLCPAASAAYGSAYFPNGQLSGTSFGIPGQSASYDYIVRPLVALRLRINSTFIDCP